MSRRPPSSLFGPEPEELQKSAAQPSYGCICFAVPAKLLKKLAEKAGEEACRDLHQHIVHSAHLRVDRDSCALGAQERPQTVAGKKQPYQRSVFNAGLGTNLPGVPLRHEGAKPARDVVANEVYDNTGVALEFYRTFLGRQSLDGRGMRVDSAIHFGQNFANAMWTGKQMVYGDGDQNVSGFTSAVDIIAHELTHGVIQHMIPGGLGVVKVPVKKREFREQVYALQGQSGALNESFSDVVGSMVKQWHQGQTSAQASWLVGEHMLAPQHGRAVRSLKDPGNRKLTWYEDDQFKSMDQYVDGADVHDSSGIPNHAFYLAARKMGGHSWEKAGLIWYDAYGCLKSKATFVDAAHATAKMAGHRFGVNSKECKAVVSAWKHVKVTT